MSNLASRIEQIRSKPLADMKAYHVQPAKDVIKLDAMENPFTWPTEIQTLWLESLKSVSVNRYPDAGASGLKRLLRQQFDIAEDYPIVLGNGSDELILLLAQMVQQPDVSIMGVEPSFVMYRQIARSLNLNYIGINLKSDDFSIDREATLAAIKTHQPSVIFLAIPNNPTGNVFDEQTIEEIIQASNGLVVLDEAYTAFTDYDSKKWLRYDHVVIMRTVSKIGLAGLRLGYLFANPLITNELEKIRLPYNINCLTQHTASFILGHADILEQQSERLVEQRALLHQALTDLAAFEAFPSQANFILARVNHRLSAREIFEQLKQKGILIKCLDGGHPHLSNCLRFTVGSEAENQALIQGLSEIIG